MKSLKCPPNDLPNLIKGVLEQDQTIQTVCFDIFDTLISRNVLPEYTKILASNQLGVVLKSELSGEVLYQLRRVLESRLCKENHINGYDKEFNITDLGFAFFDALIGFDKQIVDISRNKFAQLITDIEVAVEACVQNVNRDVVDALKYCRKRGLQTAVVSDFYLPGDCMSVLLAHHELDHLVDYLFVSADHLFTKGHSGRLYDIVLETTGKSAGNILMIGDNEHADNHMAQKKGLKSIWLECAGDSEHVKPSELSVDTSQEKAGPLYEKVFDGAKIEHFPEIAFSLHLFTHELFKKALQDGVKTLFFCSKEGEFLKRLFDAYQHVRFGSPVIRTCYIVVSRKATFICSLRDLTKEDFNRLFCHYRNMSIRDFLRSLNFSEAQADEISAEAEVEADVIRQNLQEHEDFTKLLESEHFQNLYHSHKRLQKENFLAYLQAHNHDIYNDGLAIVDVGWKGSIQNNIYYALEGKVEVRGYYAGLLSPTELTEKNIKHGVLFSDFPSHTEYIHVYNNNRSLFEMLLGASHGSADGYYTVEYYHSELKNNSGRQMHGGFDEENSKSDVVGAVILDFPEERELFNNFIAPLQNEILIMHEKLTTLLVTCLLEPPDKEWFARKHARMVFRPTNAEISIYSGLYHLENFGLFEYTRFARKDKISFMQRIKNLIELKRDPAAFLETGVWPPVVLRRLGLEFLIPLEGTRRYKRIFGERK